MGTDIHIFIERKTPTGWVLIRGEHEFFDDEGYMQSYGDDAWSALDRRNYYLFSILSNQRNHYDRPFHPIAEHRGVPLDASAELRKHLMEHMEHSPSWLMVNEIVDYDWGQKRQNVSWDSTYREEVGEAWFAAFEEQVLSLGDPANLRMVFYYDS